MYSLLQQPSALSLSKNNAVFRWQLLGTDSAAEGVRKGLGVRLTFPGSLAPSAIVTKHVLFLADDDTEVDFEFLYTSTNENEIMTPTVFGTTGDYTDWIQGYALNAFKKHPSVSPFFEVTQGATVYQIDFRCRRFEYGLTPDLNITGFTELTKTALTAPADNHAANHRMAYEVFFERTYKGGDWSRVFEGVCTGNTEGVCQADIAKLLHDELLLSGVVRAYNTVTPQILPNSRRYWVRYADESGAPIVRADWVSTDVKLVMYGGVPKNLESDYGFLATLPQNPLLTNAPTAKVVTREQLHYLSWCNSTGFTKYVKVSCSFTGFFDAEPTGLNALLSAIPVHPYETVLIPIKASLVALPTDAITFKIRVLDYTGGGALSEWRNYNISDEYEEHRRYLQYVNSFGAPESVASTGTLNSSVEIERELSITTEGGLQLTKQHRAKLKLPMAYNVGYMSRWEIETAYEGVIDNTFFEVDTEGYIRLNVLNKKMPNIGSETVDPTLTIDAEPAYDAENFGTMAYNMINNDDANTPSWMTMTERLWRKVHLKKW